MDLNRHYLEFGKFLDESKTDFESKKKLTFKANASVDDFIFLRKIGSGSFGTVLLSKRTGTDDDTYAIKIMEKRHIAKMKQIVHVKSEIRFLDVLNFEFITKLDYFFMDNVYLYLVMPFIFGGEMFIHLKKLKKFDEKLCKFYAAQIVLVFDYLHYLGIIYRDLKPENILLDFDGYLKVSDLGFSKQINNERTYSLCGTPEYLAPEIILCLGYNKSVDWWSLGVLIYEMSAGYPPFRAKASMKIYEKIITGKYDCPLHFSKPLRNIIGHLIQKDRTKRFGLLKNGSKDIKTHDWFRTIDFQKIFAKEIKPPYMPRHVDDMNKNDGDFVPLRQTLTNEYSEEFSSISIHHVTRPKRDYI